MRYNNFSKRLKRYSWIGLATVFLLWGIFAFLTPLTPGSWVFFAGLFIIFGREKTQKKLTKMVGQKWSNRLRIKKLLKKIPAKMDNKL